VYGFLGLCAFGVTELRFVGGGGCRCAVLLKIFPLCGGGVGCRAFLSVSRTLISFLSSWAIDEDGVGVGAGLTFEGLMTLVGGVGLSAIRPKTSFCSVPGR